MKEDSLKMITSTLINTGNFLKEIATDKSKKQCLEAFQRCLSLIKWLKQVTKGMIY